MMHWKSMGFRRGFGIILSLSSLRWSRLMCGRYIVLSKMGSFCKTRKVHKWGFQFSRRVQNNHKKISLSVFSCTLYTANRFAVHISG